MVVFQQSLHPTQGQSPGSLPATTGGFCPTGRASRARPRCSPPAGPRLRGAGRGATPAASPCAPAPLTADTSPRGRPGLRRLEPPTGQGWRRAGEAALPQPQAAPPLPGRTLRAGAGPGARAASARRPRPQRRAGPTPWVLTAPVGTHIPPPPAGAGQAAHGPRRPRDGTRSPARRGRRHRGAGGARERGAGLPGRTRAWSGAGEAGGAGAAVTRGRPGQSCQRSGTV